MLGHPVAHSLSPVLHGAAHAALGLRGWRYDAWDVQADALPALLAGLDDTWRGLSLTMPLKRAVLPLLSGASALARQLGVVNTVLPDGAGGWRGENTDVHGLVAALADAGVGAPASALVLCGGATAASALAALTALGMAAPVVRVRSPQRAAALLQVARQLRVSPRLEPFDASRPSTADRPGSADGPDTDGSGFGASATADPGAQSGAEQLTGLLEAGVVIATVPAGASDALAHQLVRAGRRPAGVLLDVVYAPRPTPLLRAWTALGGTGLDGTAMLLHQAGEQVRLMTGCPPPLAAMRAALEMALATP